MHLSLIIADLVGGGAERSVLMTAGGLAARGHRVDIVLLRARFDAYRELLPSEVRLICLQPRPAEDSGFPATTVWRTERGSRARLARLAPDLLTRWPVAAPALLRRGASTRVRRLARYMEDERPDVVFANLPMAEYATFSAARARPVAARPHTVPVVHNTLIVPILRNADGPGTKDGKRRRYAWRDARRFVAVSKGVASAAAAAIGGSEDRFSVIYNPAGTIPELDRLTGEAPAHPWLADDGPPVLLGAGRLVWQKDFGLLIDAFARVRRERPCRLVILGEGPLRGALESRVRSLGLEGCVALPGWTDNPFASMARAALFVLSSRHEGFGNVLVEAMACGCPAVSTDCPAGPSEILGNPDLLSPVGDPEALARSMLRALSRPPDRTALRDRAARFSLERTVDGYEKLLAELATPLPSDARRVTPS